ncbi:hypothetical protein B5C34_03050 [Pacificimonas flava]|uniref:Uncharacterized protein n=2 Tax=Pacificimonas TaxID=1960290 RepID=A0A219B3Y7_9SPHN|nr:MULTISPECIES: hypothetical protein [Pacificimonas]MBZ6377803.1 hypothetical protein [Pacificimonas aurantium]OWV32529.1 hypothetical protein B5C34_03050 [Pacificimonas flava]
MPDDDDILGALRADWQRQTVDTERLYERTQRRQRRTRLLLTGKVAATILALPIALWFLWLAFAGEGSTFALAGGVLLAAFPLMLLELVGLMKLARLGAGASPEGALRAARTQAEAALNLLWSARVAALLLGAGAAGLLGLHLADHATAAGTVPIALVWLGVAGATWLWQARRARQLNAEIQRCDTMLSELEG